MGAIKDIWHSERGLLAIVIILAATVLTGLDRMTVDQWTSFVTYVFVAYVTGKTITGAMEAYKGAGQHKGQTGPGFAELGEEIKDIPAGEVA